MGLQREFRVFRYKPGWSRPRYETYTLDLPEWATVLEALMRIRRDHAPDLTLRHSCLHGSCGTCGMRINGREALACLVKVRDLPQRITVEPLYNLGVVSDLVVDMPAFYAKFEPVGRPLIRRSEYLPRAVPPEGIPHFARLESCIECGLCVSACPVAATDEAYLGPAALAAAWRVVEEPRDANPIRALDLADDPHGCWRCHMALECSEVCPTGVKPGHAIAALRAYLLASRPVYGVAATTAGGES